MLPASKKVAPWTIPHTGKRNSRLASNFTSPSCVGNDVAGRGTEPGPSVRGAQPRMLLPPPA